MQKYSVDRSQLRIARAMYAASSDLFAKTWRLNSDARIGGARSTTAPGGPTVVPTPFRSSRSLDRTDRPKKSREKRSDDRDLEEDDRNRERGGVRLAQEDREQEAQARAEAVHGDETTATAVPRSAQRAGNRIVVRAYLH